MKDIHAVPLITAGAYSAMDAVGSKLEFEDARTAYSNHGRIRQAHISDMAKQNADLRLVLFNQDFTQTADNAPFDVTDSDLLNIIAVIEFPAANYASFDDNSFATMGFLGIDVNLPFALVEGGTSLFGQLYVVTLTPTYVTTSDLSVGLLIGD